jgi:hypothetical protein
VKKPRQITKWLQIARLGFQRRNNQIVNLLRHLPIFQPFQSLPQDRVSLTGLSPSRDVSKGKAIRMCQRGVNQAHNLALIRAGAKVTGCGGCINPQANAEFAAAPCAMANYPSESHLRFCGEMPLF